MSLKQQLGLMCATIGLFMCIYYQFTITKIANTMKIESKLLDYELVSIEDYSVWGRISPEFY